MIAQDGATSANLLSLTVGDFLDRLASDAPTPGGGAAAGLGAALAAALGRMVCGLTLGRPKFAAVEPQVKRIADRLDLARGLAQRLVDEDAAAYAALSAEFKRPRTDPQRGDAIAAAALTAATVPLEIAGLARQIEADLVALEPIGNPLLISDVTCGRAFAAAAVRAAIANVRANLPLLAEKERAPFSAQLAALDTPASRTF